RFNKLNRPILSTPKLAELIPARGAQCKRRAERDEGALVPTTFARTQVKLSARNIDYGIGVVTVARPDNAAKEIHAFP
ncbi:MAG TPA: hypothetical protein VFQ89_12435, partial [Candidatus Binatia bacterium]|nr:hypothetical protein [Candidatus Binatia bacterium]